MDRSKQHLRKITEADRDTVIGMMKVFYSSPAVNTNGSEKIFNTDIDECLSDSPFLSGYVFVDDDDRVCGYAMLAHSFSTEYGRKCVWIEDIYLKEEARGKGLADGFFEFIGESYPDCILRLEAENDNVRAMASYEKNGFTVMPYAELMKLTEEH